MRLTSQRLDCTHSDAGFWLELASRLRSDVTETGEMPDAMGMKVQDDEIQAGNYKG